jgi:hypothetical protein
MVTKKKKRVVKKTKSVTELPPEQFAGSGLPYISYRKLVPVIKERDVRAKKWKSQSTRDLDRVPQGHGEPIRIVKMNFTMNCEPGTVWDVHHGYHHVTRMWQCGTGYKINNVEKRFKTLESAARFAYAYHVQRMRQLWGRGVKLKW